MNHVVDFEKNGVQQSFTVPSYNIKSVHSNIKMLSKQAKKKDKKLGLSVKEEGTQRRRMDTDPWSGKKYPVKVPVILHNLTLSGAAPIAVAHKALSFMLLAQAVPVVPENVGRRSVTVPILEVLAVGSALVKKFGWVTAAQERRTKETATVTRVHAHFFEGDTVEVTREDYRTARMVYRWVKGTEGVKYLQFFRKIFTKDVEARRMNPVLHTIPLYIKSQERAAPAPSRQRDVKEGIDIGTLSRKGSDISTKFESTEDGRLVPVEGERKKILTPFGRKGERRALVLKVLGIEEAKGCKAFHRFVDQDGNEAIWCTWKKLPVEKGKEYSVKATVVDHVVIDETPRTLLKRVNLEEGK
jgi:hypothetical protein